jgi:hypothetical protein
MSTTPKVTRVSGEVRYRRSRLRVYLGLPPVASGYRYTAVLADGKAEVVRAKTTRRCEWAYQWATPVATQQRGLASYFILSIERMHATEALREFRIEWL